MNCLKCGNGLSTVRDGSGRHKCLKCHTWHCTCPVHLTLFIWNEESVNFGLVKSMNKKCICKNKEKADIDTKKSLNELYGIRDKLNDHRSNLQTRVSQCDELISMLNIAIIDLGGE